MAMSSKIIVLVRVSLLVALAGAAAWWLFAPDKPASYAECRSGVLYTVSYRSAGELNQAVEQSASKTVVLFADTVEVRLPEYAAAQAMVFKRKLRLRTTGVAPGAWPTEQEIAWAIEQMTLARNQPVLIASVEGVRRPGMCVAAYLTSVEKMDKAAAAGRLKAIYGQAPGLADVLRFLDVYDPQSRRLTAGLPLSRE